MWINISKYLFRAYIVWSVCADLVLIAGIIALLFGDIKVSFWNPCYKGLDRGAELGACTPQPKSL